MKHVFFIITLLLLRSQAFATPSEVLGFVKNHADVLETIDEIKGYSDSIQFSKATIELLSEEYSGGNMLGGNGSTKHYLVKVPYSENMDWNGFNDTILVIVSAWNFTAIKFPGQKRLVMNAMSLGIPASKGMKIEKVFKSVKEFTLN